MKRHILCLLVSLLSLNIFSQKNAPVAGDAATLMDLLKKDYNGVDPDLRSETLSKDMFKVTSIFKSYLKDDTRQQLIKESTSTRQRYCNTQLTAHIASSAVRLSELQTVATASLCSKIEELPYYLSQYNKAKKEYKDLQNLQRATAAELGNRLNTLNIEKSEYFNLKYYSDLNNLIRLKALYGTDNKYLSYILELFITKYTTILHKQEDYFAQINYNSSIQKALPFLGGDLTFETIIDALSKFIANQIKKELTTHAIEKIQYYLNHPSEESYLNELLVLLPKTTEYLKSFEASQVPSFTDDFKQYIEKDLNKLLFNAINLQHTPRFKKLAQRYPDIGFAFEALELIPKMSKIKEPLDYFKILEKSPNLQRWATNPNQKAKFNIANSIKLTSLLAHSLLVIDEGKQKLVSLDFMSNYGSEKEFYLLYVGFLHQQQLKYYKVQFIGKNTTTPMPLDFKVLMHKIPAQTLDTAEQSIALINTHISQIVSNTEKLQTYIEAVKKANKDDKEVPIETIHGLVDTFVEFSEAVAKTADMLIDQNNNLDLVNIETTDIIGKSQPYFNTARAVNDIFLDLHQKRFTTAIISALEIPSNFTSDDISISKLTNLQTMVAGSSHLNTLKRFVSHSKIPGSETKKKALKELAMEVEYILLQVDDDQLQNVRTKFNTVHNALKTGNNDAFKTELINFKTLLLSEYTAVLDHYAQLPFSDSVITPITNYIDNGPLHAALKTDLKSYIAIFSKSVFQAYTLDNDKGLETAKETLFRYTTKYLPELSKNVLNIKDQNILKIVSFVANVALSENKDQVETALETFALPTGSSAIKEDMKTYFSINSYPGILGGFEFSDQSNIEDAEHIGITAPIGIYGQIAKNKLGTWGIFIPIIDIAAPVRLRFDDDKDTEALPDFDFKDIFAPGAYLSYGFNNLPFAINAGIQYGPKLRDIDDGNGVFRDVEAYRVSLGVVIDIPLFTLYNKGID